MPLLMVRKVQRLVQVDEIKNILTSAYKYIITNR